MSHFDTYFSSLFNQDSKAPKISGNIYSVFRRRRYYRKNFTEMVYLLQEGKLEFHRLSAVHLNENQLSEFISLGNWPSRCDAHMIPSPSFDG